MLFIAILTYWMLFSCSKRCLDLWRMHLIKYDLFLSWNCWSRVTNLSSHTRELRCGISGTCIFLRVNFLGQVIRISYRRSFTGLFLWKIAAIAVKFRDLPGGWEYTLQYYRKFRIETCLVRMPNQRTQYWWRLPHTFRLSEV